MRTKLLSLLPLLLISGVMYALGQSSAASEPNAGIKEYLATHFQIRVDIRFLQEKDDPVLASTINADLRALQNVVLVKEKPDLVLILMGRYTGRSYTCSYFVMHPANETMMNAIAARVMIGMKAKGSKDDPLATSLINSNKNFYGPVYDLHDYGITGGGDAPSMVDAVLKAFDSRSLEPLRQDDQKMRDEFQDDLKAAKP